MTRFPLHDLTHINDFHCIGYAVVADSKRHTIFFKTCDPDFGTLKISQNADLPPECFVGENPETSSSELAQLPAALIGADTLLAAALCNIHGLWENSKAIKVSN